MAVVRIICKDINGNGKDIGKAINGNDKDDW